ncbi:MAG: hypothetical protein FVQ77_12105 [Cytophagales bacterium]|nr:hypothetical protein [Cytophagales bacterium]
MNILFFFIHPEYSGAIDSWPGTPIKIHEEAKKKIKKEKRLSVGREKASYVKTEYGRVSYQRKRGTIQKLRRRNR